MKSTLKKFAAGLVALAFVTPLAMAEPGGGKKPGGDKGGKKRPEGGRPDRAATLAKYDADGDGKLSEDERVTMLKDRLKENEKFAEMFTKRADTDGDGELSDEEIKAAAAKFSGRGERPDRKGGGRADGGKGGKGGAGGKAGGKKRPDVEL